MSRLFYVRHGESEANEKNIFAGGLNDSPLTEKGRIQAVQAAKSLPKDIRYVISSPLSRAKETAEIIAEEIGFNQDQIKIDERLREYSVGAAEGTPMHVVSSLELVAFEGAENPNAFKERVFGVLIDAKNFPGNVLIVAHGGVAKLIECVRQGKNPKYFYDMPKQDNATVLELDLSWINEVTL